MRTLNFLNELTFSLWKVPIETGEERRENPLRNSYCLSEASLTVSGFFRAPQRTPKGLVHLGCLSLGYLSFGQAKKGTKAYFELVESKITLN
jgi:hypothetical protein